MKVLHIAAGGLSGGAARGAYWLHKAQREIGLDSKMLIGGAGDPADPSVISLSDSFFQRLRLRLALRLDAQFARLYPKRMLRIFSTGFAGADFTHRKEFKEADVIHLHWITGVVSMRALSKIKKPVVWTLRDMWPLTGGCHYAMGCERYESGCGKCPQLGSQSFYDLSRLVLIKKRGWLPKKLALVGISEWLSQCARTSSLFNGLAIQTISNNIDAAGFFPEHKDDARRALNLPLNRKIVLIGAQQLDDFYKGFDLFLQALDRLEMQDVHLLLFGRTEEGLLEKLGRPYSNLGFVSDTETLRMAYSAADVFAAPSRMDAFGKTLAESMACGTPVVCFDATGPRDVVAHLQTGYRAKPFDPSDFAAGIRWVLGRSPSERESLRYAARQRVIENFDASVIARQYDNLYREMVAQEEGYE